MFGKNKHVYTCPDSIHDHKVAKRNGRMILGLYAAAAAATYGYGKVLEKREQRADLTIVPDLTS